MHSTSQRISKAAWQETYQLISIETYNLLTDLHIICYNFSLLLEKWLIKQHNIWPFAREQPPANVILFLEKSQDQLETFWKTDKNIDPL